MNNTPALFDVAGVDGRTNRALFFLAVAVPIFVVAGFVALMMDANILASFLAMAGIICMVTLFMLVIRVRQITASIQQVRRDALATWPHETGEVAISTAGLYQSEPPKLVPFAAVTGAAISEQPEPMLTLSYLPRAESEEPSRVAIPIPTDRLDEAREIVNTIVG